MLTQSGAHGVIITVVMSLSFVFLVEMEDFGPVFIQEPDDVIYPLDSVEKKVVMPCEARGNPPPTYRCDICKFVHLLLLQLSY